MLAIDALSDARLLPESDVIVVDEGHELADRATGAVTDELTAPMVERAARRGDSSGDVIGQDRHLVGVELGLILGGAWLARRGSAR